MKENKIKKIYRNICLSEFTLNEIHELKTKIDNNSRNMDDLYNMLNKVKRNTDEIVFANIFHDTIKNSEWFNIPLSLSSGAIGYNMAYIIYRTLNDIKPKKILELGLGQSTKIINEYAKYFKNIEHDIVEHNKEWIDFFEKSVYTLVSPDLEYLCHI